ncbi:hypothetical protein HK101_001909 [Irineochytrium annulatum]|nr:hypothetical protein HK101_001909 [Irineochytrium annulatum]
MSSCDASLLLAKLASEAAFYRADASNTHASVLRLQLQMEDLEHAHALRVHEAEARLDVVSRHGSYLRACLESSLAEAESLRLIICQQQALINQHTQQAEFERCSVAGDDDCSSRECCSSEGNGSTLFDSASACAAGSVESIKGRSRRSPKWLAKITSVLFLNKHDH